MTSVSNIRFVFGFRSPYAWLANKWLEANLDAQALENVTFIPYWNPRPDTLAQLEAGQGEFLYREMSRDRHMYILADIRRLAAKFGASVSWPGETPGADWEAPHRVYLAAEKMGLGALARRLIFDARWSQGLNICDPAILEGLAIEIGLDSETYLAAINDDVDEKLLEPLRLTSRMRVFGLPHFQVGRQKFWGFDRLGFALEAAGLTARAYHDAWSGVAA